MRKQFAELNYPDGESGDWKIINFEVEDCELRKARSIRDGCARDYVPAGKYIRLQRGSTTVMSDTPMELYSNIDFVRKAKGNVLINGLGLGLIAKTIALKQNVEKVTIIEISQDLINLIEPYMPDNVEIICANAFEYSPPKGVRFGAVWHDIWDDVCTDNLPEITKLHRKYGKRCDYQDSWVRDRLKDMKRRENIYGY